MTLDSLVTSVNKRIGEGTMIRGRDLKQHTFPRLQTGSLALDLSLGGGWPMNCWNEISGEPSNGKSVIALKTIANAQAVDKDFHCLWIAAEPFVPAWAETCGVDLDRMLIADTQVMEEAYQICIDALEERLVDAVVIDSLSSLVPMEEDEKAMDQMQVALGARITGKFMRKSNTAQRRSMTDVNDRPCLGIIISQWREKVGVMYGDNRVTPYGRAKEFFYMVRAEVRKDGWLGTDKRRVGLTFKVHTVKNKTAPPQRNAVIDFYWEDYEGHKAGQYNVAKQLVAVGLDLEIIEAKGAYYGYLDKKYQGKDRLNEAIEADATMQKALDYDIRQRVLGLGLVVTDTDKPRRRIKKTA